MGFLVAVLRGREARLGGLDRRLLVEEGRFGPSIARRRKLSDSSRGWPTTDRPTSAPRTGIWVWYLALASSRVTCAVATLVLALSTRACGSINGLRRLRLGLDEGGLRLGIGILGGFECLLGAQQRGVVLRLGGAQRTLGAGDLHLGRLARRLGARDRIPVGSLGAIELRLQSVEAIRGHPCTPTG